MGEIADEHTDQAPHSGRAPGQYARASVRRLRLRTLLVLGAFAVATSLIGRALGVHDNRFLAATEGLLVCMFAVSRVVLPIVDRRDRGASAEEHVGWLLDATLPGWTSLMAAVGLLGGMQFLMLGIIGAYLGRLYDQSKGRPLFMIRDIVGGPK